MTNILLCVSVLALAIQGALFGFWLKELSRELTSQRQQLLQLQKELL